MDQGRGFSISFHLLALATSLRREMCAAVKGGLSQTLSIRWSCPLYSNHTFGLLPLKENIHF